MIKYLYRLGHVIKLFFSSFLSSNKSTWLKFWFTGNKIKISLRNNLFSVRNKSLFTKISDYAMLREVLISDCYGLAEIKPDSVIIDIGAHIGGFSVHAGKIATRGKIYAYEPFWSSYQLLKENIKLNNLKNVIASELAVNNQNGFIDLYINPINFAENSLNKKFSESIKVYSTTLEDVFFYNKINKCDLLKIDCEGSEYNILYSSGKILNRINQIIVEYHIPKHFNIDKNNSPLKLLNYLKLYGFKIIIKKTNYYQGIIYAYKEKVI